MKKNQFIDLNIDPLRFVFPIMSPMCGTQGGVNSQKKIRWKQIQ